MKRGVYIIVTFVLILSSFSFLGVAFMDHGASEKCPFSILSSNDCESVVDATGSLLHHITASQTFTNALLVSSVGTLLALLATVAFLFLRHFFKPPINFNQLYREVRAQHKVVVLTPNPILRWIALLNKRDTHSNFWRVVA